MDDAATLPVRNYPEFTDPVRPDYVVLLLLEENVFQLIRKVRTHN
jgi:hypothetical protein